jgi:HK97 gp10 family phage protein
MPVIRGLRELNDALHELPEDMAKAAHRTGVRKGARVLADGMERRAPRATGELAGSMVISIRRRGRGIVALVGPSKGAFHGMFQEFGTSHHPAQPFMRPTVDEDGQRAVEAMREQLGVAVDRAVRRLARKAKA